MPRLFRRLPAASAVLASLLLVSCGGGGAGSTASSGPSAASQQLAQQVQAPTFTGDTAVDAFNWFNYRRKQASSGLLLNLEWNSNIALAAQRHADYQRNNPIPPTSTTLGSPIRHDEVPGTLGFFGVNACTRMKAALYPISCPLLPGSAYGEVISYMGDPSGFVNAESLIAAIYHRFVIFEPVFREAGAGFTKDSFNATILNVNFASHDGLATGLTTDQYINYPFPGQQFVPTSFSSDSETPDPVPLSDPNNPNSKVDIVGYPISIQINGTDCLDTESFKVKQVTGAFLETHLLTNAPNATAGTPSDPETPPSAAAIIPLSPLLPKTTYQVQFSGTIRYYDASTGKCAVGGNRITPSWTFTTQ